jgi:sporulation protein YlmC with PRC-barrel domain
LRPDQLGGKEVIDSKANVIGDVCGIEFNIPDWTVTHVCINLSDKSIEELGFKKPRFRGKVLVDLPVDIIRAVSDVMTINKSIEELKDLVEEHG